MMADRPNQEGGAAPPNPEVNPATARSDTDAPLQSERTALLGSMAAGLAHEFNNLLTVALSSLNQIRRQPLDETGATQLERAEWATRQAGRLAQQVLAFMHHGRAERQMIDVNAAISDFDKMLGHIAGDRVKLRIELAEQALPARLDPGQLELALLNLVRNASDAMPHGGRVVIRTAAHSPTPSEARPMAEVAVSDEGAGMPAAVAERATSAFFTTKSPGKGTGLGLWMVQRFVRASEGKLEIETAVGRGTTVRLLFPLHSAS